MIVLLNQTIKDARIKARDSENGSRNYQDAMGILYSEYRKANGEYANASWGDGSGFDKLWNWIDSLYAAEQSREFGELMGKDDISDWDSEHGFTSTAPAPELPLPNAEIIAELEKEIEKHENSIAEMRQDLDMIAEHSAKHNTYNILCPLC